MEEHNQVASDVYCMSVHDLLCISERWKYNRQPDISKMKEIAECNVDRLMIDGIVSVALIYEEGFPKYVRFDGNHRAESGKYMSDGGRNINVLVRLYKFSDCKEMKERFREINKVDPCPDIYLKEDNDKTKSIPIEVYLHYYDKYPQFFSTSSRPMRPNINKSTLLTTIEEIAPMKSAVDIINIFDKYNTFLVKKPIKFFKKADKYNFYLFSDREFLRNSLALAM